MRRILTSLIVLTTLARAAPLPVGVPVFGTSQYVEYIPGDLPWVISAPHGGKLKPDEIPSRTYGVRGADSNTQELALALANECMTRSGHRPHLIISHLHRSKLDPNREVVEAAQGNASAIKAWTEYHTFIEQARAAVTAKHGLTFLIDLHGQNHPDPRVELGYLHAPNELAQSPTIINAPTFAAKGSLSLLAQRSNLPYTELLHGPSSLGAMLAEHGFHSTPSPKLPVPNEPYFRGGYTVARHCTGKTTGLQVECQYTRLRDTNSHRLQFARALVTSLEQYLATHLKLYLR